MCKVLSHAHGTGAPPDEKLPGQLALCQCHSLRDGARTWGWGQDGGRWRVIAITPLCCAPARAPFSLVFELRHHTSHASFEPKETNKEQPKSARWKPDSLPPPPRGAPFRRRLRHSKTAGKQRVYTNCHDTSDRHAVFAGFRYTTTST